MAAEEVTTEASTEDMTETETETSNELTSEIATENGNVIIYDEEVPLASGVEDKAGYVWIWWCVLALAAVAGLTGKTLYDMKRKRGFFKEK